MTEGSTHTPLCSSCHQKDAEIARLKKARPVVWKITSLLMDRGNGGFFATEELAKKRAEYQANLYGRADLDGGSPHKVEHNEDRTEWTCGGYFWRVHPVEVYTDEDYL